MEKVFDNLKHYWSKTNRFHRAFFVLLLVELKLLPQGKTGFACNDPTLSHPFTGDTISWKWLMAICIFLPLIVMVIVERRYHNTGSGDTNKRTLRWYREYVYGYLVNICVTQLTKLIIGAPRPHFFDTCKPEEANTCESTDFVSTYTCSSTTWNTSMQSDKSFPSGHTSLGLHAGLFIAYYLHKRLSSNCSVKSVRVLQGSVIFLAIVCAISRITDRRHHYTDVFGGAVIGIVLFLYTVYYLCKDFECVVRSDRKT